MDDLSHLSELSLTSVGKIERGAQSPSVETLVRLTTVLGIDPGEVVRGITSDHFEERPRQFTARDFIRERMAREQPAKGRGAPGIAPGSGPAGTADDAAGEWPVERKSS